MPDSIPVLSAEQQSQATRLLELIANPANDMVWIQDLHTVSTCASSDDADWEPVADLDFGSEEDLRQIIEHTLVPLIHLGLKTEELWRDPIEQRICAVIEVPAEDGELVYALLDVFWHHVPERERPTMVLIVKHDADLYE